MTSVGLVAASLCRGELPITATQRRGYINFNFGAVSGDQGFIS
jgi:hypothetical protein